MPKGKKKWTQKKIPYSRNAIFPVEKVLDSRIGKGGVKEYQLKWLNFPESESTWEPEGNIIQHVMPDTDKEKLIEKDPLGDASTSSLSERGEEDTALSKEINDNVVKVVSGNFNFICECQILLCSSTICIPFPSTEN